ncbi:uncharacterized protein LOC122066831 [Macadamia integrifolia]|uniref:uncharacterized protein LOC122066831 n=1 Tax=Macadamia integrifolia TaxID=60698 RepID=UPI001C500CBF|nr:uncharacterized protein LOC122066831 [Macadamia integrifolia]
MIHAAKFRAMVDACDLISSPSQGPKFTWTNNRRRGHVAAVLARSFFNAQWLDIFSDCGQQVLHRSVSDHAPILFSSAAVAKPRNAPFRFHRFWMEEESFEGLVREVWSREVRGGPIGRLAQKLKAVKGTLKGWARRVFLNIDVELKEATEGVEEVQRIIDQVGMSDELYSREAEAKTRLLKAVELHEKLWDEKARCKWANLGDRNSKFFHLSVKMAEYVSHFFGEFHKADHCVDHMELLQVIPKEVNREDFLILEVIPERDEIKKVVWGLDPDSYPSPDRFPGAFLKQCWEIVGEDFCKVVMAFFRGGKLLNGVNNSFVTLIPKVEGAVSLDKFRPIYMENFFCKVLSKIMAERLSCLLPRLVSNEQGAFQKGKIISANIGLASELANLLHTSVRGGGMGIKDFSVVEWWSDGVFWCGAGIETRGPDFPNAIYSHRGSVVRGLNGLLKEGKMKAPPGPRGASVPSHLLFTDDIFIFKNSVAKYVRCLRDFLLKYQEFSGKKFNLEKIKIFFGKVTPHRIRYIADLLSIPTFPLPTRYLGVGIFKGAVKKDRLLPMMDKIKSRLQGMEGQTAIYGRSCRDDSFYDLRYANS